MKKLFTILLMFISATAFCQVGGMSLSPNGAPPDPSAMLDVNSVNKGVLIPRLTQGQRDSISNPAFGLLILNTTTNCINLWLGATWKQICGDCDFGTPVPGNNGPICEGQNLSLTATTILGATYHWTGPNGFTDTAQNPTIPNATVGASGSYSVQATLNGCTSQAQSTVATVNAIPQTPVANNNGPCVGQTLILTSSTIIGASYSWSGPNSFTGNTQNPVIGDAQTAQSGIYNVIASLSGCNSAPGSTTVFISQTPSTPGSINGLGVICGNTSGIGYSIDTLAEATTYTWSVPAGATITSGQGTNSIIITSGSSSGNISVTAGNLCGTSAASVLGVTTLSSPLTFSYTGNVQTFTVPACASSLTIDAYGAQGGSNTVSYNNQGGLGGHNQATFSINPGTVLYVYVGSQPNSYVGGYNGGGNGVGLGEGGGGASDVRMGGTDLNSRIIVAGGGGGVPQQWSSTGGTGGGTNGGDPTGGAGGTYGGYNGYGATQNAGGQGNPVYGESVSDEGSFGQGGTGGFENNSGGGGGGGYYGGGGGDAGPGGGGSGYVTGVGSSNVSYNSGVQSGNGQVVITW